MANLFGRIRRILPILVEWIQPTNVVRWRHEKYRPRWCHLLRKETLRQQTTIAAPNMSKRLERPWERNDLPSFENPGTNPGWKAQLALAQAVLEAPSVTVDGIRYWSDRFYLNHAPGDPLPGSGCTCGAKQAPPLFCRERLVQSLDLQAAVLGTFSLDPSWLMETFPHLVGPHATVPTLIVHGDKKFTNPSRQRRQDRQAEHSDDDADTSSLSALYESSQERQPVHSATRLYQDDAFRMEPLHQSREEVPVVASTIPLVDFASARLAGEILEESTTSKSSEAQQSLQTQQQQGQSASEATMVNVCASIEVAAAKMATPRSASNGSSQVDNSKPSVTPESVAFEDVDPGRHCYFSRVLSAWRKPKDSRTNGHVSVESTTAERNETQNPLAAKRGVHHPKFMLLLETSGDIVVVVSTANLTRTRTVEGSWVQRFRPNRRFQQQQQRWRKTNQTAAASLGGDRNNYLPMPVKVNDFGVVLQDFLEKLDDSVLEGDKRIREFFQEHLEFPLMELAQSFFFEKAQVHLVPVVPGDFATSNGKKTKKTKTKTQILPIRYGRHRVQEILQQQNLVQSCKDRLIVQPTSFGANWKQGELADVVRSYLDVRPNGGDEDSYDKPLDYWDDEALLDRVDIVWPSRTYVRSAMALEGAEVDENKDASSGNDSDGPKLSFVFLSSQGFNSIDKACISRMTRFQSSYPAQRPFPLVPHFKSIGRLVAQHSAVRKHGFQTMAAQEYLSWFLLTSACLSHGAQGKRVVETDPFAKSKESVEYANFELGVLFTSRIQTKEKRLYAFSPCGCLCKSIGDPQQKMIHLPIPYSLRPKPYFEDEDDTVMQETPFFHEVEDGTRCVGNMLLTPYGVRQAEKQRKRRNK